VPGQFLNDKGNIGLNDSNIAADSPFACSFIFAWLFPLLIINDHSDHDLILLLF
jgi:hypothetical protein